MKPTAVIAMVVVLASCASTPKLQYYTVDLTPSGSGSTGVNLEVDGLRVAEKIDRHQIVIHSSPTRIEYYKTGRWAASVGEMVEQKLAAEFGPPVDGRRTLIVGGAITAFEQVDSPAGPQGRVRMEVVVREDGSRRFDTPLLEKTYEATRVADGDSIDAVVRALSHALEDLAAAIAEDAAEL